jgi:hypothetical protein
VRKTRTRLGTLPTGRLKEATYKKVTPFRKQNVFHIQGTLHSHGNLISTSHRIPELKDQRRQCKSYAYIYPEA